MALKHEGYRDCEGCSPWISNGCQLKKTVYRFCPCVECLVKVICSKICDERVDAYDKLYISTMSKEEDT